MDVTPLTSAGFAHTRKFFRIPLFRGMAPKSPPKAHVQEFRSPECQTPLSHSAT